MHVMCTCLLSIGPHSINSGNKWLFLVRPQVDKVTCTMYKIQVYKLYQGLIEPRKRREGM